jgi:diguanylate cyclase (GGDEF)-like protein
MTASLGLATLPGAAADARELIAKADEALYEAKHAGRNRVALARAGAGRAQG